MAAAARVADHVVVAGQGCSEVTAAAAVTAATDQMAGFSSIASVFSKEVPGCSKTPETMRCAAFMGGIHHWLSGVSIFPSLPCMLSFQDQMGLCVLRVIWL